MNRISLSELPTAGSKVFEIGGRRVLICRGTGGIRAMDEICPHQDLTLEGARVRQNFLMCPHHGARFDLGDGRSLSPLTTRPLRLFETRIEGEELIIELGG